jgi:hypothetical protein
VNEWKRSLGWSRTGLSFACLSVVLPRGETYGGISFARWYGGSAVEAALDRVDWCMRRGAFGFEGCFDADDVKVRRIALDGLVGGAAASRRHRIHILFDAILVLLVYCGLVGYI